MAKNKQKRREKNILAVPGQNTLISENRKFVDAQFGKELPLDKEEIEYLLKTLGERFEIKQLIAKHSRDWLYYAVYRITSWPVTIQITRSQYVYEEAIAWQGYKEGSQLEKIIEVGKLDSGYFYIVSELSVHPDMRLLASSKNLSTQQALALVRELCTVVASLHDQGLSHCEIDPFNVIYLSQNQHVTLHVIRRPFFRNVLGLTLDENSDQGLNRREADEVEIQSVAYQMSQVDPQILPKLSRDLLATHPLDGWMYSLLNPFVAPECVVGPGDERADVYSLGALLYWLLVGEPHIDIKEEFEAQRITKDYLPDPIGKKHILKLLFEPFYAVKLNGLRYNSDKIPIEVKDILLKALEGVPTDRFRNVLSLAKALDHLTLNSFIITVLTSKGNAVKGADVILSKIESQDRFNAQTDESGKVHFQKLFSGIYNIKVAHKDYHSPIIDPKSIHIGSPKKSLEIRLEPIGLFNRLFS